MNVSQLGVTLPNPPQVSVLTCKNIDNFNPSDYFWLEKTDGERAVVIVYDNSVYLYRKGKLEPLPPSNDRRGNGSPHGSARGSAHDSTHGSTHDSVHGSAHDSVHDSAHDSTHGSTHDSVHGSAYDSTHGSTHDSVHGSEHDSVHDPTHDPLHDSPHIDTYAAYLYRTQAITANSTPPSKSSHLCTMLDTEYYNGKYLIFDCPIFESKDISSSPYSLRMEKCKAILNSHPNIFILKQYYEITNFNDLLSFVNNNYTSPRTNNVIDGIILQHKTLSYKSKEPIAYKLKRTVMNTIDFRIVYEERRRVFYLYLRGTKFDLTRNRKKLPKINNHSIVHVNVDLHKLPDSDFYILFASSFREGLHVFRPRLIWDTSAYFPQETKLIKELMKSILEDPRKYSNKILELSLNVDGWVPIKVRDDKEHSNNYNVGISNVSIMFNPITPGQRR